MYQSDQMIRIKTIHIWYRTLRSNAKYMSGVKITLSNGEQSPYFKGTQRQEGPVALNIEQNENPYNIVMEISPWACLGIKISNN